jgi:hypothetical protein
VSVSVAGAGVFAGERIEKNSKREFYSVSAL